MNSDLSVTIVQADLVWQSIDENLSRFSKILSEIENSTDLIVLPEMFTTGFSLDVNLLAEDEHSKALAWMKESAVKMNSSLVGSIIFKENNHFFNRLFFVQPDGTYQKYDKKHLFRMGEENTKYTPGNENILVNLKSWKIRPLVCYDLRFPVWSRNTDDYDLLIYIANWPDSRSEQWMTLLRARAIENQSYVIGVNRVGTDGNNWYYGGNSLIINPLGKILNKNNTPVEFVETINLSLDELRNYRKNFPALLDRDEFKIL